MRKNLPPLLTHGHTEVDARSLAFLSQRHSALSRGFVNGQSAFSLPFGSQLDLSRDGDERRGAEGRGEGRTARLQRTPLGPNLVSLSVISHTSSSGFE